MGDLSKNFSRSEFECTCGCGTDTVDYTLVNSLQMMVYQLELKYNSVSVRITSGNRCEAHNETVQKEYNSRYVPFSSKSQHRLYKAADFKVYYRDSEYEKKQLNPEIVNEYLKTEYPSKFGIGLYSNRNHLDVRATRARWVKK